MVYSKKAFLNNNNNTNNNNNNNNGNSNAQYPTLAPNSNRVAIEKVN